MSTDENKDLLNRYTEEIWNKGNFSLMGEMFDPGFTFNYPDLDLTSDLEGFKQTIIRFRNAFPDIEFTTEYMIAEGNMTVSRWKGTGTHKGEYMGVSPTSKKIIVTGITILQIEDKKIMEEQTEMDVAGLMQQIGAVSSP